MWWPGRGTSVRTPRSGKQATGSQRDRLAWLLALATVFCLAAALLFSKGTQLLMPGPLASAHGAIENCSSCHTRIGSGKVSWLHGLVAGERFTDSKACLTCHKMPDTAFNAHGASIEMLEASTRRLTKIAAQTPAPQSARAQDAAFPAHDVAARGLTCATCHQEHQGANFKLNKISNEQCRSCHVVKFDSFDGNHPNFENYPFKTRSPIIYDHAGHFGKHYPELAKKDPTKRIPETCSSCHNSGDDKRVMAVAPFERTCSGCHLDQIVGKERATGPKGIAFLTLPGLDVETLKEKNAAVGEWPEASEAALTPFMKVMISRSDRGRALIKTVDGLNLQDLTKATDDQIKAVTSLAWEIKGLFHALISGKTSSVLGDLNIAGGAKLSPSLVADLTASIPRDVVISAQQQWLPNLAAEMAARPEPAAQKQTNLSPVNTKADGSPPRDDKPATEGRAPVPAPESQAAGRNVAPAGKTDAAKAKPDAGKAPRSTNDLPPAMRAGVGDPDKATAPDDAAKSKDVEEELSIDERGEAAIKGRSLLPSGTPRSIGARNKKKAQPEAATGGGKRTPAVDAPPGANPAGSNDRKATGATPDTESAKSDGAKEAPPVANEPQDNATSQSDDLLFPTEAELRDMKSGSSSPETAKPPAQATGKSDAAAVTTPEAPGSAGTASKPDANAPVSTSADSDTKATTAQTKATPVISIGSDVDPESWAEFGGWYRQDYAIFYRPTGHKDKFIYSWLFLTGPQSPRDQKSPAASVFDSLTNKDAQGSCTKCHSVDDIPGKGRLVNFSPRSVSSKQGRFTKFIHEPHFGIMENRGCLTCHGLENGRPYVKSYEQGSPQTFVSNFGDVKKDLCQSCHTSSKARQDCLLCHSYHVNGAVTPIMSTKIPIR